MTSKYEKKLNEIIDNFFVIILPSTFNNISGYELFQQILMLLNGSINFSVQCYDLNNGITSDMSGNLENLPVNISQNFNLFY